MTPSRQGFLDGYLEKTAQVPEEPTSITGQPPAPAATQPPEAKPGIWNWMKGKINKAVPQIRDIRTGRIVRAVQENDQAYIKAHLEDYAEYQRQIQGGFSNWLDTTPGAKAIIGKQLWSRYKMPIVAGGTAVLGAMALPWIYMAMTRNRQPQQQPAAAPNPYGRQPAAWESAKPFRMGEQQRQQMQWQQMQNYQAALARSQQT